MDILLAKPRGFCAGVNRAIALVRSALAEFGAPVYVLHEIVHNTHVLNELEAMGAIFVEELEEIPKGARAIFSAHGIARAVEEEAIAMHLRTIDATCPLVAKVHRRISRLHAQGCALLVLGHKGHPEVEGTCGQVPGPVYVVSTPEEVAALPIPFTAKVGYVRQLSAEGLLSLKPDAVVGTSDAGPPVVLDQIRQAGVRVALVKAQHNWAEVQDKVKVVGRETGRMADADKLLAQLEAQWRGVQAQVAKAQRKPRVLFVLAHSGSPQVAGKGVAASALIEYAGCVNAIDQFDGYKPLTAEAMASAAPEVIISTTQGIEALGGEAAFWKRPELALTPAFAKKALVTLEASHLLGFGPRLPSAVQALHMRSLQWVA